MQSRVAMAWSRSPKEWLRLPSRIALLLGFGALSAANVHANTTEIDVRSESPRTPQQSAKTFGELRIWSQGGRIYVSESGKPAQELRLGETAEARQLQQLLERDGAVAGSPRKILDRIILVGGGGAGMHWAPAENGRTSQPPGAPAATGFSPSAPGTPAQTTPSQNPRVQGKTTTTDNSERR
jgi:hypothetical protein